MTIRAVLLDVGGVLLRTEDQQPRRRWEERLQLPPDSLISVVFDNPVAQQANLGFAEAEDVWREVGRLLSLSPPKLRQLQSDFFAGDRWDEELLSLVRSLRPAVRTGVLSNAWPDARAKQARWIHPAIFDVILYSAEVHCRKPEEEFFRLALFHLNAAPEEVLFFDDFQENVDAACRIGLQGVLFEDSLTAVHAIRTALPGFYAE